MRWTPGGENEDVEDRRGESAGGGGGGFGFGGGGGFGGIHLGIGGTLIVLVLSLVFRTNLFQFLGNGGGDQGAPVRSERPVSSDVGEERSKQLMVYVLRDVQKTWEKLLPEQGVQYRHAKLDLYRDSIRSACGQAESATGPFYCPEDEKVYIDLGFFQELRTKFGAPGEFAQSYVLAHEIGHHVQKLLGIEGKVRRLQERDPSQENPLSVRLELQADCFAGVWAHSTEERQIIDQNDVAQGLQAAASVGDDRLQRQASRQVRPETFTHGSSAKRMQWFKAGLEKGQIGACNTFTR